MLKFRSKNLVLSVLKNVAVVSVICLCWWSTSLLYLYNKYSLLFGGLVSLSVDSYLVFAASWDQATSWAKIICILKFVFNWRIIALQCCVGFCHTTKWVSHKYTYVPSIFCLPPTPAISHPPSCHIALTWAPCVTQQEVISFLFVGSFSKDFMARIKCLFFCPIIICHLHFFSTHTPISPTRRVGPQLWGSSIETQN